VEVQCDWGSIPISAPSALVALSHDGTIGIAYSGNSAWLCTNWPDQPAAIAIGLPDTATAAAPAPDNQRVFIGFAGGTLAALDVSTGALEAGTISLGFAPAGIAVSPIWPRSPVVITGKGGEIAIL
jgi:hypothetical protein